MKSRLSKYQQEKEEEEKTKEEELSSLTPFEDDDGMLVWVVLIHQNHRRKDQLLEEPYEQLGLLFDWRSGGGMRIAWLGHDEKVGRTTIDSRRGEMGRK